MENTGTIAVATLKSKLVELGKELTEINKRREEIQEERRHLEFVIENYGMKHVIQQEEMKLSSRDATLAKQDTARFSRIQIIEKILREIGQPMRSIDIRKELELRGTTIPQNSFDSIMSVESRNPDSRITKAGYGKYKYRYAA